MLCFQKRIGNNFRAISEIIQQKVVLVSWEKLAQINLWFGGSQKYIKSAFTTFWSHLHSSVLDSFNRTTGFLLYFVWTIKCGCGIAHCFIAWKWNVRADWCVLSFWLRMSGWHILSLPWAFRSCLSLPGKTDSKQTACPFYTNCDFLNLHVEVKYVTVNIYNRKLKNDCPGLLYHNSIRIIYFLVLEAWL